jgi:hypothetical protein
MKPSAPSRLSLLENRRQKLLRGIAQLDRKIAKTELRLARLTFADKKAA